MNFCNIIGSKTWRSKNKTKKLKIGLNNLIVEFIRYKSCVDLIKNIKTKQKQNKNKTKKQKKKQKTKNKKKKKPKTKIEKLGKKNLLKPISLNLIRISFSG